MAKNAEQTKQLEQATNVELTKSLLNKPDFLKYLEDYEGPDLDPTNAADVKELEKRHEAFELKTVVTKELKDLYKKQIKEDLKISIGDAELAEVEQFVAQEARTNPDSLKVLQGQIREFHEGAGRLAGKEAEVKTQLERHGGLSGLESHGRQINKAARKDQGLIKRLFTKPTADQELAKNTLARDYKIEDLGKARMKVDEAIDLAKQLESLQEARHLLFRDLGPAKDIFEKTKERAQAELKRLAESLNKNSGLAGLERLRTRLDQMKGAGEKTGNNYLEDFTADIETESGEKKHVDAKILDEATDTAIERMVGEQMRDALNHRTAMSEVENTVKKVLAREKIGSKKGKEVKEFVVSYLQDQSRSNPSRAKRLIVNTMLASLELTSV